MLKYVLIILAGMIIPITVKAESTDNSAVAFVYFQIHDDGYGSGTLDADSFGQHIKLFKSDRYNILPLANAMQGLRTKTELPKNTVVLTFEGAFKSTYETALKSLIQEEIPFTLFFAPERIDRNSPRYMNWEELRSLKRYPFISFGLLPSEYDYLSSMTSQQIRQKINNALSRSQDELDIRPAFFAIPYGIYQTQHLEILETYNFEGIFGQHSGVLTSHDLDGVLPRFPITDGYGDTDRIEAIARSKPLYLENITPENHDITLDGSEQNLRIGFTRNVAHHPKDEAINCFGSGVGKLNLHQISDDRFEIRLPTPIGTDRLRINCTQRYDRPVPGEMPRSRWYGMLYGITEPVSVPENNFFSE